jgi:hypothetical protein
MPAANRKQILLLVGLAALWAVLLGWQLLSSDEPVRAPLKNRSGAVAAPRSPATPAGLRVNLELLAASSGQHEASFTTPRNIFTSLVGKGTSSGQAAQDVPPEQQLPTPSEERKLAAAADLNQFRYLGFLRFGDRKGGRKQAMAVLLREDELHLVHAGDTIAKQVLVRAIESDGVTLQHLGSRMVQVIPAAQEPLAGTTEN